MSVEPVDIKEEEDNGLDLYDEALVRDINYQMSPTGTVEEDKYDVKSPNFRESPSQSSPEKTEKNERKNVFQFYVGNLTWWTSDEDIASLVILLGVKDLVDIRIFEKRTNGQSKGFSIVAVGSETSFRTCMQKLSGQMLNGNSLVTAPYSKQWYTHFDALASAQPPACQFQNQNLEPLPMPPSLNVSKPSFAVEAENRKGRPTMAQPKSGFPSSNSVPPLCHQLPPRMPLWPPNNRPGLPCPPQQSIPPRRPMPVPLPNVNSVCGTGVPSGPPMGPVVPNQQWRFPPKIGPGPQQQQQHPPPGSNWPRAPSPHHGVYHPPGPPMFPPQPPPHMVHPNHGQTPMYGRPPFSRPPASTIPSPVIQTLPSKKPSDEIEDETIIRNRAVSSKALSKAMSDVGSGNYSCAIETLTTAIDIIEQSKMSRDDRSRTLISTLADMLQVVVKTARTVGSMKRTSESRCSSPSSHGGISRSYSRRSRNRSRSTSRSRGSRSRSQSRERGHHHHRERSSRRCDREEKDESNRDYRDREQRRDRASTSSRRRSDRSSERSGTHYVTTTRDREREHEHENRRSYDRDRLSRAKSKNPSPSLSPDRVKDWGHRHRDS